MPDLRRPRPQRSADLDDVAARIRGMAATAAPAVDHGLEESFADVADALDELLFLARTGGARLDDLERATVDPLLRTQVQLAHTRTGELARRLLGLVQRARAEGAEPDLDRLDAERRRCAAFLRTQHAVVAAYAGAAEWQSPPFDSGVTPHWDDYKRDRHAAAAAFERAYVAEMVDGPERLHALLASCGMSAFTTILVFLLFEGRLDRGVVAGAALYHETKLLLSRSAAALFVDERDTNALLRAIRERRPGAVFLDSLCNTRFAPRPDLRAVVGELRGARQSTYLVIDNTALSAACQPFELVGDDARIAPIVFESLLKYQQLGLDRANAGVIVARAEDAQQLDVYREHLGTNIGDVAALALPPPRRAMLERRLARIFRNAELIAARLEVDHTGGGCVSVALRPEDERVLVDQAIRAAARADVPLVAGSSFGFDVTRIYPTAAQADCGEPFVRIAAGAEHRLAAERVADVLAEALARVRT